MDRSNRTSHNPWLGDVRPHRNQVGALVSGLLPSTDPIGTLSALVNVANDGERPLYVSKNGGSPQAWRTGSVDITRQASSVGWDDADEFAVRMFAGRDDSLDARFTRNNDSDWVVVVRRIADAAHDPATLLHALVKPIEVSGFILSGYAGSEPQFGLGWLQMVPDGGDPLGRWDAGDFMHRLLGYHHFTLVGPCFQKDAPSSLDALRHHETDSGARSYDLRAVDDLDEAAVETFKLAFGDRLPGWAVAHGANYELPLFEGRPVPQQLLSFVEVFLRMGEVPAEMPLPRRIEASPKPHQLGLYARSDSRFDSTLIVYALDALNDALVRRSRKLSDGCRFRDIGLELKQLAETEFEIRANGAGQASLFLELIADSLLNWSMAAPEGVHVFTHVAWISGVEEHLR